MSFHCFSVFRLIYKESKEIMFKIFFFKLGCLIIISILLFPLLLWGVIKLNAIDNRWIENGISRSFEKKESSFDMSFFPIREIVIENENTFTLFGTKNQFTSQNNKPVYLRTTDGGNSWKMSEIDINVNMAFFDRVGDSIFMITYIEKKDSVHRIAYVSNGNFEKWEYFGNVKLRDVGILYENKEDSLLNDGTFVLERGNIATLSVDDLCNGDPVYASNNENWIVCGYDEDSTSTHETRIVYRSGKTYKVHTSFPNKRHLWRLKNMDAKDFFVKENFMAGIFKFSKSSMTDIFYLYYSIDGGKKWYNEKIPSFSHERLLVTRKNIIVLGIDEFFHEKRGRATILTMPIPKN